MQETEVKHMDMSTRVQKRKRIRSGMAAAVLASLTLGLALSGCSRKGPEIKEPGTENPGPEIQPEKTEQKGQDNGMNEARLLAEPDYPSLPDRETDWEAWRAYIDEYAVSEDFQAAIGDFSYRTASSLIQGRETNLVYSPVSLYYALSLAASGTGGETRKELARFLGMDPAEEEADTFGEEANRLYHLLNRSTSFSQLHIATSLWVSPAFSLKEAFLDTAVKQYYASVYETDFANESAGKSMGQWVSEETRGVVAPEIKTTGQELMHLMNTIYFYDEWTDVFLEEKTRDDVFYPENGDEFTIPFMNRSYGSHGYAVGDGFVRSYLPLKESAFMAFVLPDKGTPVEELANSPERLRDVLEGGEGHTGEVTFQVPKFQSDSQCNIKAMMESLGCTGIFESGDFSFMTEEPGIFVSAITQKSHISINEKGVEAASFTDMAYTGAAMPDGRAEMILNRPFLYGIKDNGVWLFIGVCDYPEEQTGELGAGR